MTALDFLKVLGGTGAVVAALFGGAYWGIQKLFEHKLAERMEDYRHVHALAAQNETIRLELYNRRFEIFSSIFDFYASLIVWEGTPEQVAAWARFFKAYQESGFLFRKDSDIEQLLKQLNDDGAKIIGFKENRETYKSDPALFQRLFDESNGIQVTSFPDALNEIRSAMSQYLNFHNLER